MLPFCTMYVILFHSLGLKFSLILFPLYCCITTKKIQFPSLCFTTLLLSLVLCLLYYALLCILSLYLHSKWVLMLNILHQCPGLLLEITSDKTTNRNLTPKTS
uniref:Uncharacterized protein n=1 Tax=Cacopsylla melanoneura TaxID=428564 RepID=A0A8D8US57_9HEMI